MDSLEEKKWINTNNFFMASDVNLEALNTTHARITSKFILPALTFLPELWTPVNKLPTWHCHLDV